MKNHRRIKLIAASIALMASFSAVAGLGGLNVQSNLGEPFSGTVTVTGEEAKILLNGGQATLSDNGLRSSVRKSGNNAIVSIRSSRAVQDPVLIFQLGVGSQARQYTAIIDPKGYAANSGNRAPVNQSDRQAAARERVAAAVAAGNGEVRRSAPAARAPERRAAPSPRQAQANRTPARQPAAVREGAYTVRQGENLTAIASRVRPGGLSTYQTVQALVAANPELFRNQSADRLWPGNVLNIPSASELRRLAQQGASAPVAEPVVAASEPAPATPTEQPATEQPASAAATAAASEPVATPASVPAAASEATAAVSEPAVSAPAATEPVAEQAVEASQPAKEESSGLWRWLLLGGLGLIALWILSKLLGKKQKNIVLKDDAVVEEDNQSPFDAAPKADTGIRTEQPIARPSKAAPLTRAEAAATMGAATAAASAAKKPAPVKDELEMEDDFDDDIFFTEVSEVPSKSNADIDLDLGAIDQQQNGILSGAVTHDAETEQRKTADWDSIESTESVYEPEPEPTYQHVSAEIPVVDVPAMDADISAVAVERDLTPLEFEAPAADEKIDAKAAVVDTAEEASVAEEAWFKEIDQNANIEMQGDEDFAAEAAPAVESTETIEWEDLGVDDSNRDSSGFISESVGMTAPLEAKYELAKMYVEIGDPEAAKETLLELLEESDGAILAKTKAMLAELNG